MAMNSFTSHPSIRIKGTENNYEPIQCIDPGCPNKTPHMHCPFCVKADHYHDPVILKAHYRVKHVDKGIEFGGLKVLRCCDHCYIVGSIKGAKEFKGAHWHCYRCRNGFNRRDEAFKHYRTHFRNPQTTFQIQVATEVNQMFSFNEEAENATQVLNATEHSIAAADGPSFLPAGSSLVTVTSDVTHSALANVLNGKTTNENSTGDIQVSVAANETVGTSEPATIMICVQEDEAPDATSITDVTIEEVDATEEIDADNWQLVKERLEHQLSVISQQNAHLAVVNDKLLTEKDHLQKEISLQAQNFKAQLEAHRDELEQCRLREQELVDQLSVPLDCTVTDLLTSLKTQHEELLHQQLARLRQSYLQPLSPEPQNGGIITLTPSSQSQSLVTNTQQHNGDDIQLKVSVDGLLTHSRADPNGVYMYTDSTGDGGDAIMLVKTEITEDDDVHSASSALLSTVKETIGQKHKLVDDEIHLKTYSKAKRHKES